MHLPPEEAPNGRVRLEEEKSRSAVTSMFVSKVLPVASLKRLTRSSAVLTETESAHTHTTKHIVRKKIGTKLMRVIVGVSNSMKTLQSLFLLT